MVSLGETKTPAKKMAGDVLSALITSYLEHGQLVPKPSKQKNKAVYLIAPDAKVQAALLLRKARASTPQIKIAEAMHTSWQAYQKIESPTNNTTLTKLQKAARALGRELVIDLV